MSVRSIESGGDVLPVRNQSISHSIQNVVIHTERMNKAEGIENIE